MPQRMPDPGSEPVVPPQTHCALRLQQAVRALDLLRQELPANTPAAQYVHVGLATLGRLEGALRAAQLLPPPGRGVASLDAPAEVRLDGQAG